MRSVVVDGVDVLSVEGKQTVPNRRVTMAQVSTITCLCDGDSYLAQVPDSTIVQLAIPRPLPPFSATFSSTHPSFTPPPPPKAAAGHAKKSISSTTSADPVVAALKRTRTQKRERANVHVLYTANGKIRPPGKQESAATSVPLLDAREGETKVDKAHLRRIARRAHRMGHLPPPSSHRHAHIPAGISKGKPTSGPWVNPFVPAAWFWSAPEEVGGKSGGYAYGFAGSAPGAREWEERRRKGGVYVRDRMR